MAVVDSPEDFYVYVDQEYNKLGDADIRRILDKFIAAGWLKGYIEELPSEYDCMVMMSYQHDYIKKFLARVKYKRLIFIEEGFSDYVKTDLSEGYKDAELYLNNIELLNIKDAYKSVEQLNYSEDLLQNFFGLIGFNTNTIGIKADVIFFTSPIDTDFGYEKYRSDVVKYLNEHYKGKTVLLKKHPRDFNNYSGDYNIVEIDRAIPGQFVDFSYDCEKLYAHPSTVLLSSRDFSKTTIFRFNEIQRKRYRDIYDFSVVKNCKIYDF